MHNDPLLQVLILLAASVCVVAAVRKLKLPAILGYLAVGMLLGPHALRLAADTDTTQSLADFGVVFLVFTLGLEFSLPRMVAMRWEVLGVGGAQVLITTAAVAAASTIFFRRGPGGRSGHRRRSRHVVHRHHHLAAHRAIRKQPYSWAARRRDLPVSGFELSIAVGFSVRARRERNPGGSATHRRGGGERIAGIAVWSWPPAAGCCGLYLC